jgi:hypothetical protein
MKTGTKSWIWIGSLLLIALTPWRAAADLDLNAGFLFDEFPLTLSSGHRTEALGPFFYSETNDAQKTWAVPPLISRTTDPLTDFTEFDFVYPLLTYDRFGSEFRWQLFQLLSFSGGQNQEQQKTRRFTLFPIYFQQRSEDPDANYTALFPLYGRLKKRLLRDEIFFVMFPIYGQSRKKDVVTDNYLYPFFHLRHGTSLSGWQFWPVVGHEHKDVTTKTNGFGETEVTGGYDNLFVLWPIFLKQRNGIGTENPISQHAVFPFYSVYRSPQRDSTSLLWVFFSHVIDREKKYTEWDAPWPLIVFARGEGKTTSRVWPFFSHAEKESSESAFYLWPFYKYNHVHGDLIDRQRMRIMFYLYSDTIQKNVTTGEAQRRVNFWPFFDHRSDYNGSSRLQVFAPMEPILPNSKSVERNWSPLWSVWRSEKNTKTGAASQSLLWNFYRHESAPDSKKCSLCFGLFQYQSGSDGKRLRLFYIPVVKTKPTAETGSK